MKLPCPECNAEVDIVPVGDELYVDNHHRGFNRTLYRPETDDLPREQFEFAKRCELSGARVRVKR